MTLGHQVIQTEEQNSNTQFNSHRLIFPETYRLKRIQSIPPETWTGTPMRKWFSINNHTRHSLPGLALHLHSSTLLLRPRSIRVLIDHYRSLPSRILIAHYSHRLFSRPSFLLARSCSQLFHLPPKALTNPDPIIHIILIPLD